MPPNAARAFRLRWQIRPARSPAGRVRSFCSSASPSGVRAGFGISKDSRIPTTTTASRRSKLANRRVFASIAFSTAIWLAVTESSAGPATPSQNSRPMEEYGVSAEGKDHRANVSLKTPTPLQKAYFISQYKFGAGYEELCQSHRPYKVRSQPAVFHVKHCCTQLILTYC